MVQTPLDILGKTAEEFFVNIIIIIIIIIIDSLLALKVRVPEQGSS